MNTSKTPMDIDDDNLLLHPDDGDSFDLPTNDREIDDLLNDDNDDRQHLTDRPVTPMKSFITLNCADIGSANYPIKASVKCGFAVRNLFLQNESDSQIAINTDCRAMTDFYKTESWWFSQIQSAKTMLYQSPPYNWARAARVLEFNQPKAYYTFNGPNNKQILRNITFPMTNEFIQLLPTPFLGPDGFFNIRISFVAQFGHDNKPANMTSDQGWKSVEPHLKFIYPAARIMAESYMEIPAIDNTDPDIRLFITQSKRNFEENCKNNFYGLPQRRLNPFYQTKPVTPPQATNASPNTSFLDASVKAVSEKLRLKHQNLTSPEKQAATQKITTTMLSEITKEASNHNSSASSDSEDSDQDPQELLNAYSSKEKMEIVEQAAILANVPKKERQLIKIITATGNQSPLRKRLTPTRTDPSREKGYTTEVPIKADIKPLATSRERRIHEHYSPSNRHSRNQRSQSPSPSQHRPYDRRYRQNNYDDNHHSNKYQHRPRYYDSGPYYQPRNQTYEPQRRSAHSRLEPRVHPSRHTSPEGPRAKLYTSRPPSPEGPPPRSQPPSPLPVTDLRHTLTPPVTPLCDTQTAEDKHVNDSFENLPLFNEEEEFKYKHFRNKNGERVLVKQSSKHRKPKTSTDNLDLPDINPNTATK